MSETWQILLKRVRFAYSLGQKQLAEKLGVDQTTISRWERGIITPDVDIQRTVREMLRKHDPSLSSEAIAMLPIVTALVYQDNIAKLRAVSAVAASAHGMTVEEALEADFEKLLPDSILRANADIMEHPAWRKGEAAGFETLHRRNDKLWYRCVGLIVGPSNIVQWTAAPTIPPPNPRSEIVKSRVITLDELVL